MLKHNSLFWKIFTAIWLANILAIFTTAYFVLHSRNDDDRQRNREEIAQAIGNHIIPLLEQGQNLQPRPWLRDPFPFRVIDDNGTILYDGLPPKADDYLRQPPPPNTLYEHDYTSESGKHYHIYLPPPERPHFLKYYLHHMLAMRLLVIFTVSGLVSLVLTRLITRPLKQLGEQTRAIAEGDLQANITPKLLKRKDEIGDLARECDLMINNISQLLEGQQRLLHDVSHELRAPLARLMAALGLQQQKSELDGKMLQRIEDECDQMNRLIEHILNLARMEKHVPQFQPLKLSNLLQEVVEDCRFEFPHHQIMLQPTANEKNLNADKSILHAAFSNLVRNACQHTSAETAIIIRQEQCDNKTIIHICDNGPGVDDATLQQLFTPFYRKSCTSNGFGLGLNISQRAIEKHGGKLTASHNDPQGLCFHACLPI